MQQDVAQSLGAREHRALLQSVCRLSGPRSGVRLGARVRWHCIPCLSGSCRCRWMRC
ncbi:hypothetical protein B0H10DRAFT_2135052, partial [Mycena sp. CBHHK59/15]